MSVDKEQIKKMVEEVSLRSIRLKYSESEIFFPAEFIRPDSTNIDINYAFEHQFDEERKILFSFVGVEVAGTVKEPQEGHQEAQEEEMETLFHSQNSFVLQYEFKNIFDDKLLDFFTRNNALFNASPYIREHVQSTLAKMGIVNFYLPLLKPSPE